MPIELSVKYKSGPNPGQWRFSFSPSLLCYRRLIPKSIFTLVIDCLRRISNPIENGFRQFQKLSGLYPDLGSLPGLPALWLVHLVNVII